MATKSRETIPKKQSSKIIGIQFSILSPDEIRKGSVAEITTRDTYINNKPVIGGLFDPRMGVLEPGLICPTDGLDYMETPGYFGHIELARPVFYIQYLNTIMKILRCVCIKCSKLKISKKTHKQALKLSSEDRWNYVFKLASASNITRCGDDISDGCGCLQPKKFKKEGLATLFAEWDNINGLGDDDKDKLNMKLTPEIVLKIFRRISDDDVNFMGFSPVFSRPDWMICQVLAVPPPAVRPSIKMDGQQRSEDDISHILVNIIKANKTLQEKIQENASSNIIDDWHTVLQYYVATQVDNKIPGVASVAQRSGRPLKSIKERLNGKGGRVRGNLMGKRVDFSARSVITPDPNLSIRELGIPLKVAKNITKPVTVNKNNKKFLLRLVRNGPDGWPGAKILEKKNGEQITLRYADRLNIQLDNGDIVHRHMMDGDGVLFNRQPTLHRMSMMCHIAVIMHKGDTFRMNVADTKPYNADFDGDEMNLHMPQDEESEAELKGLAAVPYQIVSPANNSSIVGIFQDSLLGAYRFTRPNIKFSQLEAMNLLMTFNKINTDVLKDKKEISNFDILTQIMPPLTMKFGNKAFPDSGEDFKTSNKVVEIVGGKYERGQMEKSVLGGSNGLLQRICNYFGNMASSDFIDDLQNVVTEYMKTSSFSVGISDLIADNTTNEKIAETITKKKQEVKNLIDQTHLGIFENKTGKTNEQEFETQVTNVLNNATSEAGKIGRKSLDKGNRFVIMVNAGSKGSDINISQMISCLGQQTVDGKRIPYGFDNRTLPHYTKYDDSPTARGFVESSFISGLSPEELFFHAMGGRVGLIDTAVKTSQTGYIQRRLIKGLEDLKVEYDMTVRNNKQKIVQFHYGDDGIDTVRVEDQILPLVSMNLEEIYAHFHMPSENEANSLFSTPYTKGASNRMKKQKQELIELNEKYIDYMIERRDEIVKNIFKYTDSKKIKIPVAFQHIINNIQGLQNINKNSMVDITPLETYQLLETIMKKLENIHFAPPTELFKVMYYYYLSPKELLLVKRFNRKSVEVLLDTIVNVYKNAIVAPGEMVGMIAAQSIGEPTTQMSCVGCENIRVIKKNKHTGQINSMRTEIGTFCDELIEQLPEYTFNTGHYDSVETLLDTLDEEYYIIGVDGEEKTHWNKISHVSRHPVNGELMKVTTKSGRIVETTTSHSHLIRKNNTVEPITGANMSVGMRIPVTKHIDNNFKQCSIEIGDKQYKLDYLFGWFVGAYLAEGNIEQNRIYITSIHNDFIQNTHQIATRFGKTASTYNGRGEYGPSSKTSFTHKELAQLLLKTCNTGSFVKTVPEFAFTAPNEFKVGLIQAYFDGDGNFVCDANHHQIRVCSRSKQLIKDMALLRNYFDILGPIKENMAKGTTMYNLAISAKYASAYHKQIGSLKHEDILNELVKYNNRDNVHSLSDDIDRINGLGDVIAKCGKILKLPGQSRNYGRWANKESIGRRTLEKYIDTFTYHPDAREIQSELQILQQAANSNVIWDEVKSIEIYTPDQTEYVYDFTVPANQTFMTDYGIIVHNTLNTFHFAGVASKSNVTRGVPRIEEILSLSENPKNPSVTIYLPKDQENSREEAQNLIPEIEHTKLQEIVSSIEICFDPDDLNTLIEDDIDTLTQYYEFENMMDDCVGHSADSKEKSKWIIRMEMDKESMLDKNITMDDINFAVSNAFEDEVHCVYSDYNSDKLIFRLRLNNVLANKKKISKVNSLDQSDEIYLLKNFQDNLLNNIVMSGVKNISKVILRKITDSVVKEDGKFNKKEAWVLDTVGTNLLEILSLDYIDVSRTISNDIQEVYRVFGIEAARNAIFTELTEVIEFDSTYINYHHLSMLCDRMCYSNKPISIFRHGINNDNIGPIAKASFEETPEMFLRAARHAELDPMRGVSANVMCGQQGYFGTAAFQVMLDINAMANQEVPDLDEEDSDEVIDGFFEGKKESQFCSTTNLTIENNAINIEATDLGQDDDYEIDF